MPNMATPQYSSAAGPPRATAPNKVAVVPAMEYAGATPATPMITESKSPRAPDLRLFSGVRAAGISGACVMKYRSPSVAPWSIVEVPQCSTNESPTPRPTGRSKRVRVRRSSRESGARADR